MSAHPPAERGSRTRTPVIPGFLRVPVKFLGLILVTLAAVAVPAAARVATLNSPLTAARFGSRAASVWSRVLCAILGIRVRAAGRPEGDRYLVASNHLTYLDIWVLGSLYPGVFVAKREIRSWPVVGWICRAAGTLFVDRENPRDAVRVIRVIGEHLAAGIPVTVFPEGSTSRGEEVRPFQAALLEPAARGRVPCYAASVTYETPGTAEPPAVTICWTDRFNVLKHITRVMRMPRIEATVSFSRQPAVSSDRKQLARELWQESRAAFVPLRQHTSPPPCAR